MFTRAMMCSLWKTSACLLMFGLVSAIDVSSSSNYTRNTTCSQVIYYKTSEKNECFLCYCQNGTEVCWPRDRRLCGQVGRDLARPRSRVRRSPVSLSDIFFRDATRDFFGKQIAEQCKPFESSFSDGCPPADWCIGCTVCDCDANGRWDCHILSFCNGAERKKKLKGGKIPLPARPTRRANQNKAVLNTKTSSKPKKELKSKPKFQGIKKKKNESAKKKINNRKFSNNDSKPSKVGKKLNNGGKAPSNVRKSTNKKINKKQGPKQQLQKRNTTKRPQKHIYRKNPQQKRTSIKQQMITKPPKKLKRKAVDLTAEHQKQSEVLSKLMNPEKKLTESALGRKLIKRVMEKVQKMLAKQMENLHNTTRVQRSIDDKNNKDCQKNKTNKTAKAMLKKRKLKNYSQQYNFRKKREALDLDLSIIDLSETNFKNDYTGNENLFVKIDIKNDTEYVKPDSNTTKTSLTENTTTNKGSANSTTERSTTTENLMLMVSSTANTTHYKYFVGTNISNEPIATEISPTTRDMKTSIASKPMVMEKAINLTGINVERARQYAIIMRNPKYYNNLKQKMWDTLHKNTRILQDNAININSVSKFNETIGRSKYSSMNGSLIKQSNNILRHKKIKRKLGLAHKHNLKRIIMSNFKIVPTNYVGNITPTNTSHNISSLQGLLQNLIKELNNNSTAPKKLNNQVNVFKYLRNIYKNIFSRKKDNFYKSHKTNEGMTLQILCGNIGACFNNKHNRIALRSKIHDLNAETEKIFKTVKTKKGLLRLIETPKNTTKKVINSDMQKLDSILRDAYEGNTSLTETQAVQVSYIKENVNQFTGSVTKFATLLNEIIEVLYKNNKKYSCQRNLRLGYKKRKLDSLNKIKDLLMKYNIMENKFMKKMYQLLTNVEKNMTTEYPKPKVSVKDLNNTQAIKTYSKHIIENLRRLKNLAKTLNSNRRKRQTMRDDDALEYLLVLMEYLWKKNHPVDTAPVNDGIDLLIEAIQNAPDLRSAQKKDFNEFPTTPTATRTTSVVLSYFQEDSISDSNRISKEESKSSKTENHLAIEEVVDNDEEITQIVYYKRFDDDNNTTVYNEYAPTTENIVQRNKGEIEKSGFDRFESDLDNTRRYEVFNTDLEEEPIIPIINTTDTVPITVTKVIVTKAVTKTETSTYLPLREYKLDDEPVPQNRTKLDWIEENFGQEIREYKEENDANTTIILTDPTQKPTSTKPPDQSVDNISSITVEREEEEKKKSKIATDEVLYRKQLGFLNSLDYGTEKSEFRDQSSEESEIKEDDKYSSDGFPVYFVR